MSDFLDITTTSTLEQVKKQVSGASGNERLHLQAYSVVHEELERLEVILDTVSQHFDNNYTRDSF